MTDNKLHYIMYTGDEVVAKAETLEELAEITGKTFKTISCIYKRRNTIRKKENVGLLSSEVTNLLLLNRLRRIVTSGY